MDPTLETTQRRDSITELRAYAGILVKHWVTVVTLAVAGFLVALVFSAQLAPQYEASSTLYVSARANQPVATDDLLQGSNYAHESMTSYVDLATTALVFDRVAEQLGNPSDAIANMLEVESPEGSVLLKFTATNTSPEMAASVVNAAGTVFIDVIQHEIEIAAAGQDSPVRVQVVDSAAVPEDPVGPNIASNSFLGLLAGLVLGVSVVALRVFLDTRLHSARELEEHSGYPVVGRIGFDEQIKHRPLIIHSEYHSPQAEAFRTLRTNLQFLQPGENSVTLMVTSATPSEGKTHVAANLAIVLAASGVSVVLIEADLRRPRLSHVMGIEGGAGLTDVLINRAKLAEVLQPWGLDDLTVLPAGHIPPNPSEVLGSSHMQNVLEELQDQADYVLIDAPPLLPVTDAAVISKLATGTLLVTALEQTKRQELTQAIGTLETIDSRLLGLVVNKEHAQHHRAAPKYENPVTTEKAEPIGSTS